jgi:hypothetical protein
MLGTTNIKKMNNSCYFMLMFGSYSLFVCPFTVGFFLIQHPWDRQVLEQFLKLMHIQPLFFRIVLRFRTLSPVVKKRMHALRKCVLGWAAPCMHWFLHFLVTAKLVASWNVILADQRGDQYLSQVYMEFVATPQGRFPPHIRTVHLDIIKVFLFTNWCASELS